MFLSGSGFNATVYGLVQFRYFHFKSLEYSVLLPAREMSVKE